MRRLRWKQRRAEATRSCGNSRRRTRADEGKRGEAPYHPGMEKRVVFRSAWLPYALLVPQIAVTIVFFFWPAVQAFWFSFQLQDAFGIRTEFAGLRNFTDLLRDEHYLASFKSTAVFSLLVAASGIAISLALATMADRVLRGALAYKTLLIWPYAVAPAVAGVLWAFLFAPSIGIVTYVIRKAGYNWDWVLQGDQAMLLVVMAATWKQISYNFLFFLAGLQSIPRSLVEAAAIDGAGPSRRFWTIVFPLYVTFVASTLTLDQILQVPMPLVPGDRLWENYSRALTAGASGAAAAPVGRMMLNSLVMAVAIALGKIAISLIASFAIVYFRFPLRNFFFWMIFVTLMLPVEVRIIPTYKVVSDLGMLNSYVGLTLPLIAFATATFLFRQFFLTIPEELAEASRIDGAGPMRFFFDVVLPLSKTSMAALFVIQFIYGWNQYLWPLLVTTNESMYTVVIGIKRMILGGDALTEWNVVMATAMLALLPPAAVVVLMQKWFVKGLVETEK